MAGTSHYHAQRRALAQQRAEQAFALQKEGKTLAEIGEALGISAEAVRKALKKREKAANDQIVAEMVDDKKVQLDRLELLWQAAWPVAATGEPQSVKAALSVLAEKSKLLGLNAPTKTAITDSKGKDAAPVGVFQMAMPMAPEDWLAAATARRDSEG